MIAVVVVVMTVTAMTVVVMTVVTMPFGLALGGRFMTAVRMIAIMEVPLGLAPCLRAHGTSFGLASSQVVPSPWPLQRRGERPRLAAYPATTLR